MTGERVSAEKTTPAKSLVIPEILANKSKSRQKAIQARRDGSLEEGHPERAKDNEDQFSRTFLRLIIF